MNPKLMKLAAEVANRGMQNSMLRQEPNSTQLIYDALVKVSLEAYEDSLRLVVTPRTMFLTNQAVLDGILDDNHPVILARQELRREIEQDLLIKINQLKAV